VKKMDEVPVLIVGAGPAGATAAIELARHGVESLVAERRPEPGGLPRATSVSMGSMELLRAWGLEDEVRGGAVDVEWLGWSCETLAAASGGAAFPVGYPTRAESARISPTGAVCVPQDHLEPILLRHLRSLGGTLERGLELVGVESGPDGVRATLRDPAGAQRVVRARYLIGADGAHSATRRGLGIRMTGPDGLGERIGTLFHAPLWHLVGPHRHGIYSITHPDAPGTFLPAGRGDRWVYSREWDPAQETPADYPAERMAELIRIGAGDLSVAPVFEQIRTLSFAAQIADRFRAGSAFLVGDAAHRVTPRGGTGMNTAIRDGRDIGWKLAWVLRGWADQALLDTYEAERRPIAEHNRIRSADPNGSVRGTDEELHIDLAGRIPHAWLPGDAGRVSTLDLVGQGFTLLTGPERDAWDAAAATVPAGAPLAVRSLDEVSARALGIHRGGALLARPDWLPAGAWGHGVDATSALHDAVRAIAEPREREVA